MLNKEFTTNQGYKIVIVEYKNNRNCTIRFLHNNFTKNTTYQHILSGSIKNPYHKSIFNVGYLGVGRYKSKKNGKITKYYNVWKSMLERCYNIKIQNKYPTYKGTIVCDESGKEITRESNVNKRIRYGNKTYLYNGKKYNVLKW